MVVLFSYLNAFNFLCGGIALGIGYSKVEMVLACWCVGRNGEMFMEMGRCLAEIFACVFEFLLVVGGGIMQFHFYLLFLVSLPPASLFLKKI